MIVIRGAPADMAYEYPSMAGTVRLVQVAGHWLLHFAGRRSGNWPSPDLAARVVARHRSGLPSGIAGAAMRPRTCATGGLSASRCSGRRTANELSLALTF